MENLRKRILIVDDEDLVRFVLKECLKKLGCDIVTAGDGLEAYKIIQHMDFDVVITDLKLPGISGIQLTEAIRDQYPDLAVIWITAYGQKKFRSDTNRLHVFRCLDKPLEIGVIRQAVSEALEAA